LSYHLKGVRISEAGDGLISFSYRLDPPVMIGVSDVLVDDQSQNAVFVFGSIHGAAQFIGCCPQAFFKAEVRSGSICHSVLLYGIGWDAFPSAHGWRHALIIMEENG